MSSVTSTCPGGLKRVPAHHKQPSSQRRQGWELAWGGWRKPRWVGASLA